MTAAQTAGRYVVHAAIVITASGTTPTFYIDVVQKYTFRIQENWYLPNKMIIHILLVI